VKAESLSGPTGQKRRISFGKGAVLAISVFFLVSLSPAQDGCTTAVVSGKATVDGRPLLWKNRDTEDVQNKVVFFSEGKYEAIGVVTADSSSSIWMGINSAGLAMENSASSDLDGTSSAENGSFMKYALQNCATVDEFEQLLISTNSSGRKTKANYGLIDASGGAAIFETGNQAYARFDANDPNVAPLGFIVRTNYAFTGGGGGSGYERYDRALELLTGAALNSNLSHDYILKTVARDLKNDQVDPYPLPFEGSQEGHANGYIRTNYSINRYTTRSCAVFHGVISGEDPLLSTMWIILGEPVCSVAVPLWVLAGATPAEMDGQTTAPMNEASVLKEESCYTDPTSSSTSPQYINTYAIADGAGGGLFSYTFPIENWALNQAASSMNSWRAAFPTANEMHEFEATVASQVYCSFVTSIPPSDIQPPLHLTAQTVLNRSLSQAEYINVLSWQPNPANENIVKYRIYLVEGGEKTILDEVDAGTSYFWHRKIEKREHFYSVVGVDYENKESTPACLRVGWDIPENQTRQKARTAGNENLNELDNWISRDLRPNVLDEKEPGSEMGVEEKLGEIHGPLHFAVENIRDASLLEGEFINLLTWEANPRKSAVIAYRIYLVEGKRTSLLTELSPGIFQYRHRGFELGKNARYALVALTSAGKESLLVEAQIKENGLE
jgi:hypothetical protein